jgi:hypothetical protein
MTTAPPSAETRKVSITVIEVIPARTDKLFALAAVEIDIDGVQIQVHGICARRAVPAAPPSNCRDPAAPPVLCGPPCGGELAPENETVG